MGEVKNGLYRESAVLKKERSCYRTQWPSSCDEMRKTVISNFQEVAYGLPTTKTHPV